MPYDDRDAEVEVAIAKLHRTEAAPTCLQCGSDKIVPNATVQLCLAVMADPQALLFKGWECTELTARVCGNCGHTQLFAKNPALVYSVYQQSCRNVQRTQSEQE